MVIVTHEMLVERIKDNELFKSGKMKLIGKYVSMKKYIYLQTEYGIHKALPNALYDLNWKPTILSSVNKNYYFYRKAKELHKGKYDYNYVDYKGNDVNVKIYCKKHNLFFQQVPMSHLKPSTGCLQCELEGRAKTVKLKDFKSHFLKRAYKIHGNKYDYSLVDYVNAKQPIKIICPLHGEFLITPDSHTSKKAGCKKCSNLLAGWSFSNWEKQSKLSKDFKDFQVYVLKCIDNATGEVFYKIGKTFRTVELRYEDNRKMPYDYEILKVYKSPSSKDICYLEVDLIKAFQKDYYKPSKFFEGSMRETFSKIDLNKIEKIKNKYNSITELEI